MQRKPKVFLTAEWRNLVVVNYEIDREVLAPHVPLGTELDLWQDRALISLVGFEFRDTKVCGCAIPFHRNFQEVNLRFYIRRRVEDGWRRGVCFLRELVPRRAVSWVARNLYGENYATVPMGHAIECTGREDIAARYWWRWAGRECRLQLETGGVGDVAQPGTLDEFIIEHYWGYSGGQGRATVEYEVEHRPWKLWPATASFTGEVTSLYGPVFAAALEAPPVSAFFADGSPVVVYRGTLLPPSSSASAPHTRPVAGAFAGTASRYT